MALETGDYIAALVQTNPTSSDNVSVGDEHFQLIKKILKQSFPSVDQATNVIHASATAPSTIVADGTRKGSQGLLWYDTTNSLLKFNKSTTATADWVTIAISPTTSNSVDVNAGTIDGAVIGGSSAAAITGTTVVANTSVNIASDGATVTGIKDEDDMASDSAVKLATQQSIKAYVDTQLTAEDLDFQGDSGTGAVDLDSQTLDIAGGSGITTTASSQTLTVAGDDATTSAKGVASFSSDNFGVSSGAVTIKDAGVANAELANMAANTVKVRNANSSGVPSDLALTTTQIMIGDGTGFTAAALSGDATMTNAGAVSVTGIQGQSVSSTAATNDQYLKYSSASSEWQKVDVLSPDRLTTKGDLLVYNTVDSETRLPVGTNDYVLAADSSATNGVDWQQLATAGIADNAVTLAKLEDGTQGDILYYGAAGEPTRLGFGTSGQFLKTQGTGANPVWAATTDTTYTAGDGLDLTGTAFSTDLKSTGGLAIDTTELTIDFTSDNAWTGSQRATAVTDNDGSYDMDGGQNFICTPAGNFTLTFTNITNGQSGFVKLINSGGHTVSLHANSKADANLATTVSTAGTYLLSYFSDGTDVWLTNSAIYA